MAKKFPPEAQDVTEPLPGMLDPISQAKKDKKGALRKQAEQDKKMNDVEYSGKTTLFRNEDTGEEMSKPRVRKYLGGPGFSNTPDAFNKKKGGVIKKYAKGGSVSSASSRADGCAQRGKTKGRMV